MSKRNFHGLTDTKIYRLWANMKRRCTSRNQKDYKYYGGRGIIICDEWSKDFMIFYKWAFDNGYNEGLQLDRINNNGNYEPSNCRFVTRSINCRNRRDNIILFHKGESKSLMEWAELLGFSLGTLRGRVWMGWPTERILQTPLLKSKWDKNNNKSYKVK